MPDGLYPSGDNPPPVPRVAYDPTVIDPIWPNNRLREIERIQGEQMSAIDDLNTAVANLASEQAAVTTAVTDLLAEISNLQAGVSASDDTAIEAAVANINTIAASLGTAAASAPGVPAADPTSVPSDDSSSTTGSESSTDGTPTDTSSSATPDAAAPADPTTESESASSAT